MSMVDVIWKTTWPRSIVSPLPSRCKKAVGARVPYSERGKAPCKLPGILLKSSHEPPLIMSGTYRTVVWPKTPAAIDVWQTTKGLKTQERLKYLLYVHLNICTTVPSLLGFALASWRSSRLREARIREVLNYCGAWTQTLGRGQITNQTRSRCTQNIGSKQYMLRSRVNLSTALALDNHLSFWTITRTTTQCTGNIIPWAMVFCFDLRLMLKQCVGFLAYTASIHVNTNAPIYLVQWLIMQRKHCLISG